MKKIDHPDPDLTQEEVQKCVEDRRQNLDIDHPSLTRPRTNVDPDVLKYVVSD
jgi:hypothetical protein